MRTILAIASLVLAASADLERWESFKLTHGKSYINIAEETKRYSIFQENLKTIEEHNKKFDGGETLWKMGVNQFADLSAEEIHARLRTVDKSTIEELKLRHNFTKYSSPAGVSAPSSIDWRTKGAVTPIKDQSDCGACWTFSAIGTLEGQYFVKHNQLVSFSEQNLLDCCTTCVYESDDGCDGGVIDWSFDYIRDNGIETEQDYPYEAAQGTCRFDKSRSVTTVTGYTEIENGNEPAIREAAGTIGPISVALNALNFIFYSSGIYDDTSCSHETNHGVLIVGYGQENGVDYWIIKNSWGLNFGENGYIRMKYGVNICGINQFGSYPNLP